MNLIAERLTLKEVSIEFLEDIHQLHSYPEVDEFNTLGIPAHREETRDLIAAWEEKKQLQPQTVYVFCVLLTATHQFIGLIGLNLGKPNFHNAEVWFKTLPAFWRKGYTSAALHTLLKFGFTQLKLHRIEAGAAVENIASIAVLEKAGFQKEGRKRAILPIRGKWVDNYFFAMLEEDFLANG